MRVSAVNYQTKPTYTGNNENKNNRIKNLAGATAIAVASMAPISESEAQVFPYVPNFIYETYTTTADAINTPKCFVVGDLSSNPSSNKSLRKVFNEIDTNGDGIITAKEVVDTERGNWNEEHLSSFTSLQAKNVQKRFSALAKVYNNTNSNPKTINFLEYKRIMADYEDSGNYNAVPIYTYPYYYTLPPIYHYRPHRPHIHMTPPPPPPHRHDPHRR